MAYTKIKMENPKTGEIKYAPVGFSWTVLFFNFLPPLFRGDFKYAAILFFIGPATFYLADVVLGFWYNGIYIKELVQKGFKTNEHNEKVNRSVGFRIPVIEQPSSQI